MDRELIARLRDVLKAGQQELADAYQQKFDAVALLHGRSHLVDGVLTDLWQTLGLPSEIALIAVGGYGRGELYPASDVDLLILLPAAPDSELSALLERMVGLFWDIGLEIGHSVRTIDDCLREAAGDITIQTALIETRLITGGQPLFEDFSQRLHAAVQPLPFYKAKRLEQQERYQRYQETAFSLEPNCKESPGGLRDLQVILWIAQAAGYGTEWKDIERHGFLTRGERQHLQKCERLLQNLRIRLHLMLKRREDRLLFDHQHALAQQFGYENTPAKRASEQLMQRYYQNAKAITQLNTILLQNIGAALAPAPAGAAEAINERFQIVQDLLDVSAEDVFEKTPSALLECFLMMQRHPDLKGMTARTLRALWRGRELITPNYCKKPEHRALFLQLFQSERGIVHEFRRMNQYSILGRYLPAFGKIVGQMQHDLFHVYTVDQHILMVMRNMRRFTMEEFAHEYPLCSRLINSFQRPWVLYVAALFHDIAKGRGGDHSMLGMEDARQFCETHGLLQEDTELVVWLVRKHLCMSAVAQKEDLSDPNVVTQFANQMVDKRHLIALYLLTVADIRGTSPKVWNNWKAKLLEDLFRLAMLRLETGATPEPQGVIQERQAEAMRLLRFFALSDSVHERLWKQLDTVYFLRHSAEEIAWHTRALHYRINTSEPIVKARLHPGGGLQVMVYTHDQPDLFMHLVGYFARAGYTIADAKIHTTRHGYALDSFVLLDTLDQHNDREMIAIVEYELKERLQNADEGPKKPPPGRLSRQVRHFPITPEITIRADERGTQYIMTIVAADRPGLLYTVASTLAVHRLNLNAAKITTLGERAEDVFLISGNELENSTSRLRLETELLEALQI
jgi:[protein-PII] uridylyltransferase